MMNNKLKYLIVISLMLLMVNLVNAQNVNNYNSKSIIDSMEKDLSEGLLEKWYPACVDEKYGGFLSDFTYNFKPEGKQLKMIVTQSRHIWTTAQAYKFYPSKKYYKQISEHGYKYLRDVMWDKKYGGFYDLVTQEGEVVKYKGKINKKAYGNAFAIYGLAAYYNISKDSSALQLAIKTFNWLEKNSHDNEYGGYFQYIKRDGTPYTEGAEDTPPKDQNSSIHILEAFTELYKVWPNKLLKTRLNEMLFLIRDKISTPKGYLNLFFRKDWSHVTYTDAEFNSERNKHLFDYISFGHDVETAYLMIEASSALGIKDDSVTYRKAKKMVDHSIKNGWNSKNGELYGAGYYFEKNKITILKEQTQWWAFAESFNAFLLMSEIYPNDKMNYFNKFLLAWQYTNENLIDKKNGGWFWCSAEKNANVKTRFKGSIWKGTYHNARALINCIERLKKMSK